MWIVQIDPHMLGSLKRRGVTLVVLAAVIPRGIISVIGRRSGTTWLRIRLLLMLLLLLLQYVSQLPSPFHTGFMMVHGRMGQTNHQIQTTRGWLVGLVRQRRITLLLIVGHWLLLQGMGQGRVGTILLIKSIQLVDMKRQSQDENSNTRFGWIHDLMTVNRPLFGCWCCWWRCVRPNLVVVVVVVVVCGTWHWGCLFLHCFPFRPCLGIIIRCRIQFKGDGFSSLQFTVKTSRWNLEGLGSFHDKFSGQGRRGKQVRNQPLLFLFLGLLLLFLLLLWLLEWQPLGPVGS